MISEIFSNLFISKSHKIETSNANFRKITSKEIATKNGFYYIPRLIEKKLFSNEPFVNQFYIDDGGYLSLHPINNRIFSFPSEWYGEFNGLSKIIMNNQSAFKCITNLSDILLQIIRLYSKYIDENVFISSSGFAIKLMDEIRSEYVGRASLVLTDDAIQNNKVKPAQVIEAKKYFINDFLDNFIGCNFGVAVKSNPQLEKELLEFNNLVISKGLRKDEEPVFEIHFSYDVMNYDLKKS